MLSSNGKFTRLAKWFDASRPSSFPEIVLDDGGLHGDRLLGDERLFGLRTYVSRVGAVQLHD